MHKRLRSSLQVAGQALFNFKRDDGFTLAAALSFYTLTSLIPLLMIVVSVLGHLLGRSEEAWNRINQLLTNAIPALPAVFLYHLRTLIDRKLSVVTLGWVGLFILFIFASILFSNFEKILDKIFGSVKSRNFFHSRLLSIASIFMTALLLFVPGVLKNIDQYLSRHSIPIPLSSLTTDNLFFFLVAWVSFILVLAVAPNHQVKFRYNLIGGFVFSMLLMIVKFLFRFYITFSFSRLNAVYGSLTALIVFIVGIFYLMNLFILSAELVAVLQKRWIEQNKPIEND